MPERSEKGRAKAGVRVDAACVVSWRAAKACRQPRAPVGLAITRWRERSGGDWGERVELAMVTLSHRRTDGGRSSEREKRLQTRGLSVVVVRSVGGGGEEGRKKALPGWPVWRGCCEIFGRHLWWADGLFLGGQVLR